LSDNDWDTINEESVLLEHVFVIEEDEILSGQFSQWAAESYDLAANYVYPGKKYFS
jgi:hypothetical protein